MIGAGRHVFQNTEFSLFEHYTNKLGQEKINDTNFPLYSLKPDLEMCYPH